MANTTTFDAHSSAGIPPRSTGSGARHINARDGHIAPGEIAIGWS